MVKMEQYAINVSSPSHTFAKFDKVPGTEEVLALLQDIVSGKSDRKFVLLYGITGCGKTYLIEALILAWAENRKGTYYQTMSEIMRRLKGAMRNSQDTSQMSYDELFKRLCERERLIIDDVGMGTIESRWEIAELEDIVNERYHKRYYPDGKITVMATNKDITELPDRIVSRFYDPEFGAVIHIKAQDYRRRRRKVAKNE